jgi:hypothetical protein
MTDQEIWIQHAAMNSLNAVFGQKDSTEQMTDQEIWIRDAAMNSLNAVFGQKDSTEHELNFEENVVGNIW